METDTRRARAGAADGLFDKYALPKAALTVILLASLVGTAVSMRLTVGADPLGTPAKWLYFVSLGTLTGGALWKHAFVRPADVGDAAGEYCLGMYRRFDRIAVMAAGGVAVGGVAAFGTYVGRVGEGVLGGLALALVVAVGGVAVDHARGVSLGQYRSTTGLVTLAAAVVAVAATAVAEVRLGGGGPLALGIRTLHLEAFALWVGGAVWNIFVAVPSGQERPTTPVVSAAGQQLERFRWLVRGIIPTLLATGLLQAAFAVGTRPAAYLGSLVGLAILVKLGFVVLLVGIFLTCPMWRACSPIDGVCDLSDLDRSGAGDGRAQRGTDGGGAAGSGVSDD